MTPEAWEFVNRITTLGTMPAKDEIRCLGTEAMVELAWVLCMEVKKSSNTIAQAVRVLTD